MAAKTIVFSDGEVTDLIRNAAILHMEDETGFKHNATVEWVTRDGPKAGRVALVTVEKLGATSGNPVPVPAAPKPVVPPPAAPATAPTPPVAKTP